jgi:phosphatidylglycerophosphate synthase
MLLGAALSLFASILDGCDGEVARLKLLESDFGCWLETACDYLYYLIIYAGMAIGLARTSGNTVYLGLGLLFFFGAIATFAVSSVQRRNLTDGRPEQLLEIWQKKAESRRSNPFLYLGRHLEFMIRRCFLPYPLLVFAALNIINIAFLLSVFGVNVAWLIALYSCRQFTPTKGTRRGGGSAALCAGSGEVRLQEMMTAHRRETRDAALSPAK